MAVIGMVLFGRPLDPLKRYTVIVYSSYLLPYVVCSYYPRYGFPLLAVKVLLIYWTVRWVHSRMRPSSHGDGDVTELTTS